MADLLQTIETSLAVGALYALIALGYTMVYGILQFINFAHSDIVVLGAWISYRLATELLPRMGIDPDAAPAWTGAGVLIAAMVACGLIGFVIERICYKPLRNAPRLNVLITAIGVSLLLQNVGQMPAVFGTQPERMPPLLPDVELIGIDFPAAASAEGASPGVARHVTVGLVDVVIFVTAGVLMVLLDLLVYHSKIGTAMRAVAYRPDTAALMGVHVDRIISLTFVLGSVLAAAAGFLYAMKYPGLNQPAHSTWVLLGLKAFVAAVIGGIGNVRGAVLGGFVIAFVEQFGAYYISSAYRDLYVFALLIVMLLVRPTGLLGSTVQAKVQESEPNGMGTSSNPQRLSRVEEQADALRPAAGRLWLRNAASLAVGLVGAALLDALGPKLLGDYAARMILDAGIAIILAVSLNIVNGMAGQFSLGHAGFLAVGGYTAGMVTYYGSMLLWGSPVRHGGWLGAGDCLFVAGCLAGGLVGAGVGWLMGLPTLRLRGDYLAIVTLGFGEIIRVLLQQTRPVMYSARAVAESQWKDWLPPPVGGALGFSGLPKYTNLFWVYAFVAVTVLTAHRLKFSSAGRNLISIREDEVAAVAMGVHVTRWKVRAFVIAAFFAAIAGGLFAHESGIVLSPRDAGFQRSIELVIMVVLGGNGSISGVVLAAALLASLPELLRDFDQYRMIVYAAVLIGMMLLRPQGLFGSREIWDFFRRRPLSKPSAEESA